MFMIRMMGPPPSCGCIETHLLIQRPGMAVVGLALTLAQYHGPAKQAMIMALPMPMSGALKKPAQSCIRIINGSVDREHLATSPVELVGVRGVYLFKNW